MEFIGFKVCHSQLIKMSISPITYMSSPMASE